MKPVTYEQQNNFTIKEVARLAGVSKATVSRVLNNTSYVNDETRERIEAVIKATNYTPSATAVNLSKRTMRSISVIIPEINNSFFGELMVGISEIAQEIGFTVSYCNTQNNLKLEEAALKMVQKQQTCGVIITPAGGFFEESSINDLTSMYEKLNIPVVILDRGFDISRWDGVFYENVQSTYIATKELIAVGHKKIGIITGDLNLLIGRDRLKGYMKAMEEAGLEVDKHYVLRGNFTSKAAYELTKIMLATDDYPDAMVTCNNYTTLGFLRGCKEFGKVVGKDIALIGIDHIPDLDEIGYPLSVVTRDAVEMGRKSMQLLIERLKNPTAPMQTSMIPCELRLRGSEKLVGESTNLL